MHSSSRGILVAMRFFKKTMLWLIMASVAILIVTTGMVIGQTAQQSAAQSSAQSSVKAERDQLLMVSPVEQSASVEESNFPEKSMQSDFYDDWKNWCEPLEYEKTCEADADCANIEHVAKRPLRCSHPSIGPLKNATDVNGDPLKLCLPGHSGRIERRWRYARLREFVAQQYFDETKHCPSWTWETIRNDQGKVRQFERVFDDKRPIHKQHWRCQKEWKMAEELTEFLWIVYKRETSARPWKRHRLDPDRIANERAYVRQAKRYGWIVETTCPKKKRYRSRDCYISKVYEDPEVKQSNPHYGNQYRWMFGNGGLGQNTALWTKTWDKMAPPEILCLEPAQFETYLRNARDIVANLDSGIDCDGDIEKDYWDHAPTWSVVHRGASGGKTCPPKNKAKAAEHEEKFKKRAKNRIDPDKVVTSQMLGKPIKKEGQNQRLKELLEILDEKLPAPFSNEVRSSTASIQAASP